MRSSRFSMLASIMLAIVFAASSGLQSGRGVDPEKTLQAAFNASAKVKFSAKQMWSWVINGKRLQREIEVQSTGLHSFNQQAVELVRRNYTPLVEGEDTIAGRRTWVIRLKPHTKYTPWKQLWIDSETGVVLAMRDWDSQNRIKSTMRTLSISYTDVQADFDEETVTQLSSSAQSRCLDISRMKNIPHPRYLPSGYKLVGVKKIGRAGATQLVYSDGLYSLSVFLRFPDGQGGEQNKMKRAYDWGQGLLLSTYNAGRNIVVVGDLPLKEIERIALSVR